MPASSAHNRRCKSSATPKTFPEVVAVIVCIECDEYGSLVIEDYLRSAEDAAFEL